MHQRSVWRIRSYKRSPSLAGAQKSSRAEHHMRSFDRRRSGTATGMLNDGLPRVKRSEIFCRKTPPYIFFIMSNGASWVVGLHIHVRAAQAHATLRMYLMIAHGVLCARFAPFFSRVGIYSAVLQGLRQ